MKRLPTKYLAGLIDGEGCINLRITRKRLSPRLIIVLSEPGAFILDYIQNTYGGNIYKRESHNPQWQDAYSWELTGWSKVCYVLRQLKNFLHIKRNQAELILKLENLVRGKNLTEDVIEVAKQELKLMKKDSHRLNEKALDNILGVL